MPRMIIKERLSFPYLANFVQNELPVRVSQKQQVWRAFRRFSRLSWLETFRYLKWQKDSPILRIKKLRRGDYGYFYDATPLMFFIARDIAEQFELDHSLESAKLCLEATILHELVHVADFTDGHHREPEQGIEFETEAYGSPVRVWWPRYGNAQVTQPVDFRPNATAASQNFPRKTRGIRNNNPGNIKRSNSRWKGLALPMEMTEEQKSEQVFCVFKEAVWGIRAMCKILQTYRSRGAWSILDYVQIWAPKTDANPVENYARYIAEKLELDYRNDGLDLDDHETLLGMLQSMIYFENGQQPYDDSVFFEAFNRLNY